MIFKRFALAVLIYSTSFSSFAEELVHSIQKELSFLGYSVGPLDGIAGERTISALRSFYQANGIKWYGPIDQGNLDFIVQMKGLAAASVKGNMAEEETYSDRVEIFESPKKLCEALNSRNLKMSRWKRSNSAPGEWLCLSEYFEFGTPGVLGLKNNLAYYVYGDSQARGREAVIKLNVNNKNQESQALAEFESFVSLFSSKVSYDVSTPLSRAISENISKEIKTEFGVVVFEFDKGRVDSYSVRMLDKKHIEKQAELKNASTTGFEICLEVISNEVGYTDFPLSGDGIPVNENGYESFLIKGRKGDIFFCALHSNRAFKVKASINGKFPFKYIAKGAY